MKKVAALVSFKIEPPPGAITLNADAETLAGGASGITAPPIRAVSMACGKNLSAKFLGPCCEHLRDVAN